MVTLKQRTAFDLMVKNIAKGNPKTMEQILVEAGYHKISKQAIRVYDSKGFQKLLAKVDDQKILDKFEEILMDEDKRSALSAGIELLKLKDRYPTPKTNILGLFGNLENLRDDKQ